MIDDPRSDYADGTLQDRHDAYDSYLGIPLAESCGDRAECHEYDVCPIHDTGARPKATHCPCGGAVTNRERIEFLVCTSCGELLYLNELVPARN